MDRYDVIVVGGGPAGSTCAWALRRAGRSVLVLDRATFPRDKPCAGWITPQVVETLQLDVEDYQRGRTWQVMTGFRCGLLQEEARGERDSAMVEVDYGRPVSFGIRRREFDAYLLERSAASCQLGSTVRSIRRQSGEWVVDESYAAEVLVGAGGSHCPVARWLQDQHPPRTSRELGSWIVAQEVEFPAGQAATGLGVGAPAQLMFCPDLLGYAWCVRKGEYLNIGLGRFDPLHLRARVQQFVEWLERAGLVVPGRVPGMVGHSYRAWQPARTRSLGRSPISELAADGLLLIGDAAGLAYSESGEGIRPAVESGLLAAQAILSTRDPGGGGAAELAQTYRHSIARRFPGSDSLSLAWLGRLGLGRLGLGRLMPNWLAPQLAATALGSRFWCRHLVLDRWFLRRAQPALRPPPPPQTVLT